MRRVTVSASKPYDILIGANLIDCVGKYVAQISPECTAAVISDSNAWPLYGKTVTESLNRAGIQALEYVFPAGEESKNAATYLDILNFLAENKVTRSDIILALGGGVVGDISGFCAATYLRGIRYLQIPTSLLAMVDSSVGGKTAIDLPAGKNLVGAFKQPCLVLCDISALDTLPSNVFLDGCAEVIKYGVLYDKELLTTLLQAGTAFDREAVVETCVRHKADVVVRDEFDNGERQKLNLGHTIGHGIEAASNYQITHGHAVAAGMAIVTAASVKLGFCSDDILKTVLSVLTKFSLPVTCSFTASQLFLSALSDKKRTGSSINLIVPKEIGKCDILPFPIDQLESFIEAGLSWILQSIPEN